MTIDYPSRPRRRRYAAAHGLELLAKARRLFLRAQRESGPKGDQTARLALRTGYAALNWLEDTEHEERAHALLHEAGEWTRRTYPRTCSLTWTGTQYEHRCPVALAHLRFGLSVGMVVKAKRCVLCGE